MLSIHVPLNCPAERNYVISVVFGQFLGIPVRIFPEAREDVEITNGDGRTLTLCDDFFSRADGHWLQKESMPTAPLVRWDASDESIANVLLDPNLPILYGNCSPGQPVIEADARSVRCRIDLLGSIFFMLTRYEELVNPTRDAHDRFPASASLAHREGFLTRPLADEYVEVLWLLLNRLWPGLRRKQHQYRLHLSHDVDRPYCIAGCSPLRVLRDIAGHVKRRDFAFALRQACASRKVCRGDLNADPNNSFEFIMSLSERYGLRSAFYFIADGNVPLRDGSHFVPSPLVKNLINHVSQRGHDVGLHPSYNTFQSTEQTVREFRILRDECERLGVSQQTWGGRQHFLRWSNPQTWQNWVEAGLDYDSTLGFADHPGFRCGTCREFRTYNLLSRQPLPLVERPLIVMECSLIYYMKLSWAQAVDKIVEFSRICRRFRGDFTLLWHNSLLTRDDEKQSYRMALEAVT